MRAVYLTLIAASVAFVIDLLIGRLAVKLTHVPPTFPPFTTLPILSGAVGGAILASLVYAGIHAASRNPDRLFFFVTLTFFVLSLGLPLRLSFTRSSRFAGVTPAAQTVLVLMHAVVAVVSFVAITARPEQ